ncbi:hypothetical protein BK126_04950 [Paenibacillus sp. FSL H7-0326]|uniref:hypothetical protein n=1 Tax=Paenibacillus sp. FSL H7-0326 TaxID=1921144 RepID=UPI00096F6C91|nr:hypothetical protein [Paenibacillus sp. FSL H7-0326]OMC71441.1 hypothetical protein BK126_04950 [Paenibacillus sp. FSL H7-0326]
MSNKISTTENRNAGKVKKGTDIFKKSWSLLCIGLGCGKKTGMTGLNFTSTPADILALSPFLISEWISRMKRNPQPNAIVDQPFKK